MRRISVRRPSPALVIACVTLGLVLGGTSYATVAQAPRNSVGTAQLRDSAVTGRKLANNAVSSAKVRNRSLLRADFAPGQLPAGPTGPRGPAGTAGPAGPAGPPGVSAVERTDTSSANNSTSPKSAFLACPAGKRLMGGGARVNGGSPKAAILQSFPDNDNVWRATAAESDPIPGAWSLTVFAICATAP
jgi:hypothetical protein